MQCFQFIAGFLILFGVMKVRVYYWWKYGYFNVYNMMIEKAILQGRSTWIVKKLSFDLTLYHNTWLQFIIQQYPEWNEDDEDLSIFIDDPLKGLQKFFERE